MTTDAGYHSPTERVSRSEEEERLLREIREEKERLWLEIQVRASSFVVGLLRSDCN